MDVSIIIPTLNEAARIGGAIESAWLAGAAEVIVADGGSTDGTLDVVRSQRCDIVNTKPGRAIQQNAAARKARGDVFLFLHADTNLEAGAVAQIAAAESAGASWGAFRQRIEAPGFSYRLLERANASRVRWLRLPYGDQGLFVQRDLFLASGEFPEVRLLEDLILARKLRRHSRPLLLPGPLHVSARRWQRHGVIRHTLRNWMILFGYMCGASPDALAGYYRRHDELK